MEYTRKQIYEMGKKKFVTDIVNEILLTSSLVRYFYLPHDGTYSFKGVSEDLTGDAG